MELSNILDIVDRPSAWTWIRREFLPGGVICPTCGALVTGTLALSAFAAMKRTYCKAHGGTFLAKAAIPAMRGTEWTPEEFCKFSLLHLAGADPSRIAGLLGKSIGCIRNMIDRLAVLDVKIHPGDGPSAA